MFTTRRVLAALAVTERQQTFVGQVLWAAVAQKHLAAKRRHAQIGGQPLEKIIAQ